ncbi:MAG: hypothetical protein B0W54_23985 [Cellvibrio sp. 79]|nr:MAG: hypothetical protein B0W54_23985 [Cellvibrio sp. 79]
MLINFFANQYFAHRHYRKIKKTTFLSMKNKIYYYLSVSKLFNFTVSHTLLFFMALAQLTSKSSISYDTSAATLY